MELGSRNKTSVEKLKSSVEKQKKQCRKVKSSERKVEEVELDTRRSRQDLKELDSVKKKNCFGQNNVK